MFIRKYCQSSFLALFLSACATHELPLYQENTADDIINPFINVSNAFIPQFDVVNHQAGVHDSPDTHLGIDFELEARHPFVQKWIKYFSVDHKERFERYLSRGYPYKNLVEDLLVKNGLPKEIYYIAIIESGFRVSARSRANAVGPWQFIRGTGKRFGLKINSFNDERLDPIRATIAAIRYLKSLHKVFDSWPLAFAAYNSGESRVMNAIIRYSVRDFWKLVKEKAIPRETRNYIPKFIAATLIGQNPQRYGIQLDDVQRVPELISVEFPSPIELATVGKKLGIKFSDLKKYNPNLVRAITPPHKKTYRLWLPQNKAPNAFQLAQFKAIRVDTLSRRFPTYKYKIRRGDTLYGIARKFGTSVRKLKRTNGLRSNFLRVGKVLRVPANYKEEYVKYRVRRGDSLYTLARKFGSSIRKIMKMNSMRHSRIYAGQMINVPSNKG